VGSMERETYGGARSTGGCFSRRLSPEGVALLERSGHAVGVVDDTPPRPRMRIRRVRTGRDGSRGDAP